MYNILNNVKGRGINGLYIPAFFRRGHHIYRCDPVYSSCDTRDSEDKKGRTAYGHPRTKAENVPAYPLFLRCDNAAVQPLDIAYPRHFVAFVYVCDKIN